MSLEPQLLHMYDSQFPSPLKPQLPHLPDGHQFSVAVLTISQALDTFYVNSLAVANSKFEVDSQRLLHHQHLIANEVKPLLQALLDAHAEEQVPMAWIQRCSEQFSALLMKL